MIAEQLTPIANHLWQSTLFAGAAALAAAALRRNRASLRYWLWLAASVKFLLPFSLLVTLGAQLEWRTPDAEPWPIVTAVQEYGYPIAVPATQALPAIAAPSAAAAPSVADIAIALFAVWLCGSMTVASWWIRGWRMLRSVMRSASTMALDIPIKALSCPGSVEPGVVGVFRPVLLLPAGIAERLTPAQFRAILVHELCHVRRRDNLGAALHMAVEILFWFHPMVWWIGRRLVAERERACDEEVLRVCGEPEAYAEGILSVCRLYRESPLACVAGVSGSSLKDRIEDIMKNRVADRLSAGGRAFLAAAAVAAVIGPVAMGAAGSTSNWPRPMRSSSPVSDRPLIDEARPEIAPAPPALTAQTPAAQVSSPSAQAPAGAREAFEVASVRPTRFSSGGGRGAGGGGRNSIRPAGEPCGDHPNSFFLKFDPSRAMVSDMTLFGLVAWAYDLPCRPFAGAPRLSGGPGWTKSDGYDIEALLPAGPPAFTEGQINIGGGRTATQQVMTPRFRQMLQTLLADRFKLAVRRETRDVPAYVLTVAPGGPRLTPWKDGDPVTVNELYDRLAREGRLLPEEWMAALGLTAAQVLDLHTRRELERTLFQASQTSGIRSPGGIAGAKATMAQLVDQVSRTFDPSAHRPILDKTGISTEFNFYLQFDRSAGPESRGPSVFAALEKELGLRLEPASVPMDTIVIERVERPTEN